MTEDQEQVHLPTGLIGGVEKREIVLSPYQTCWPDMSRRHADRIYGALGEVAQSIEHIGSTAVPGLAAKPIIDMLLIVEDSNDEASYLPQLERAGYVLRVRDPEFHGHRMLRTPELDMHLHVFSAGSPEVERYLLLRDRLRRNAVDRKRYEDTKVELAKRDWRDMNAYAEAKTEVIEDLIAAERRERGDTQASS